MASICHTTSRWSEREASCLPLALLAAVLVVGAAENAAARPAPRGLPKPTQELAVLLTAHEAFSKPGSGAVPLARVAATRPLTRGRTVLPVLGQATDRHGRRWLHVRLPGRPNGRTGWIRRQFTVASSTTWHLLVKTSTRRLVVYRDGRRLRTFKAIVGKRSTPTPSGQFFVEEAIRLGTNDVGAPYALALSARSNVLQAFDGGPGQIALHGLMNVGGTLGSAVSHGCIRLGNDMMRWLVARIGAGTPVTITH